MSDLPNESPDLGLKTPQELREEFEKLSWEEKDCLIRQYEALGIAVVRDQASCYKTLYSQVLKERDVEKRRALRYRVLALRRWFCNNLQSWVCTEISGDELADMLEKDVVAGNTDCLSVKTNMQLGMPKNFQK